MKQSESISVDIVRLRSYQDLAREQLGQIPENLFTGFTGLRFHVAWAPLISYVGVQPPCPTGCSVCCQLAVARAEVHPGHRTCDQHQFDGMPWNGKGHHFTCRLGVANFCRPIQVCGGTVGIAYLQALNGGDRHLTETGGGNPIGSSVFKRLDRRRLAMASRLLEFLIQSAEIACAALVSEAELADARQTIVALEHEQSHLNDLISRPMPAPAHPLCYHQPNGQANPLSARLHAYVAANYARPITLSSCADELRMNAAYLSRIFSRAFGVSFKACLTELRLLKAKELLADPTCCISDVAYTVGYASENRFRSAFKQATGIPPRVWRQLMQATTPAEVSETASESAAGVSYSVKPAKGKKRREIQNLGPLSSTKI